MLEDLFTFVKNKKILCYGAGKYGRMVYAFLKQNNLEPVGFVVSTKSDGQSMNGIPIYAIEEVADDDALGFLITVSEKYIDEIVSKVNASGKMEYFIVDEAIMSQIRNDILSQNFELKIQVRNDKRCFILGSGPTLREQDLGLLSGEVVFSCSFCSLLAEYKDIKPLFYVTPALTNDGESEEYCLEKMRYLSENVTSPFIIADYNDYALIVNNDFFENRRVYFISQPHFMPWDERNREILDLTKDSPCILSSSIMMIKLALYLGYKEIILLGLEHRVVEEQKYNHAYDFEELKRLGYSRLNEIMLMHNAKSESSCFDQNAREEFYYGLMRQYHFLNVISKNNNVRIINATPLSNLKEFDYVEYTSIFSNE